MPRTAGRASFVLCGKSQVNRSTDRDSRSVSHAVALFADIDRNDPETMFQLRDFQPQVSALVSSGRGLHVYWFLQEPVPLLQASPVANILRGISRRLNADPAVVSPAQLLRIPGSMNPKNNTICSEILVNCKIRYELEEFSEFNDPCVPQRFSESVTGSNRRGVKPGSSLPLRFVQDLEQNPSFQRLWNNQALQEFRSGSERDFALSLKLAWRDYSPDQIATILLLAPYPKKYPRTSHYPSNTVSQASAIVEHAKLMRLETTKLTAIIQ